MRMLWRGIFNASVSEIEMVEQIIVDKVARSRLSSDDCETISLPVLQICVRVDGEVVGKFSFPDPREKVLTEMNEIFEPFGFKVIPAR